MSKGLKILKSRVMYKGNGYPYRDLSGRDYITVEKELERLEAIDNANPSEALEDFKLIKFKTINAGYNYGYKVWDKIEQVLLKAQEQEKENQELKEHTRYLEITNKLLETSVEVFKEENQILKEGIKALNLSLGFDKGDKCTGDLSGYCVASITPQKEMLILLSEIIDDHEEYDRYNKIKKMLEVLENE